MSTVQIDGRPVATGTAQAFGKLAAAFAKVSGDSLHVTDGFRTYAQQETLYKEYQNGGTLAAAPGHSEHETGRALDVHDSGSDAGVTVAGTTRHKIMVGLLSQYGFKNTGDSFGEPWHIEYWGGNPYSTPTPAPVVNTVLKNGSISALVGKLQSGLNRVFPAYSKLTVDNNFGPATEAVVKNFQNRAGLVSDGIVGPATKAVLAKYGVTF